MSHDTETGNYDELPAMHAHDRGSISSSISTHNNQFIWPLTLLGILAGTAIAFSIIGFFYEKSQTDKLYTEYRLMEYYTQNEDATLIALGLKNKDQTYQESLKHHLKQEHE